MNRQQSSSHASTQRSFLMNKASLNDSRLISIARRNRKNERCVLRWTSTRKFSSSSLKSSLKSSTSSDDEANVEVDSVVFEKVLEKEGEGEERSLARTFAYGFYDSIMKSFDDFDVNEKIRNIGQYVQNGDRVQRAIKYRAGKVARSLRASSTQLIGNVNGGLDEDGTIDVDDDDGVVGSSSMTGIKTTTKKKKKAVVVYPDTTQPTIYRLNDEERKCMEFDCDEMHFVPLGEEEKWSLCLLRYLPNRLIEEVDFNKPPICFIPGCASNAYTFDVDASEGLSLPRLCADELKREVWILESRGVGHARNHQTPLESYTRTITEDVEEESDEKNNSKKKKISKVFKLSVPKIKPTLYGGWDFDTYVLVDLPAAFGYIQDLLINEHNNDNKNNSNNNNENKVMEFDLIGHSMGGMLACAIAGRSQYEHAHWSIRKVITLASSLECSSTNAQTVPSIYARFAALAGHLPLGLTGGYSALPNIHLPLQPASVATAELFTRVLGPPDEKRNEDIENPAQAFWNNSVSATTCYPGATSAKFLRKLLIYGFDNVPLSLLLQMCTLFTPGGMRSREGLRKFFTESKRPSEITIFGENKYFKDDDEDENNENKKTKKIKKPIINYVEAFTKSRTPLLAIAADSDPIFPPEQVEAFCKRVNGRFVVVGDASVNDAQITAAPTTQTTEVTASARSSTPPAPSHMSHYDVLCGKLAPILVFPEILKFLSD